MLITGMLPEDKMNKVRAALGDTAEIIYAVIIGPSISCKAMTFWDERGLRTF